MSDMKLKHCSYSQVPSHDDEFCAYKPMVEELKQKLAEAERDLESILTENHQAIGSDEFFEGLAYACKMIKPKIREALAKMRGGKV